MDNALEKLIRAAQKGNIALVQQCLDSGVEVDFVGCQRLTQFTLKAIRQTGGVDYALEEDTVNGAVRAGKALQQVLKQAKAELVGWPLAATQVLERLIDRKALSGQASCAFVGVVVIPEQRAGSRELGGSVRFRNWEFFCTDTGEFKQRNEELRELHRLRFRVADIRSVSTRN